MYAHNVKKHTTFNQETVFYSMCSNCVYARACVCACVCVCVAVRECVCLCVCVGECVWASHD